MEPIPAVSRAEHCGGYRIRIEFADGVKGTLDLEDWLEGPVFEPLKDIDYFSRFFIEAGALAWPNGADIAPETLYSRAKKTR